MATLADTARFRTDDPDPLVIASLACPICLRSDEIEWHAALDGYDPSVECRCPRCEEGWRVYLEPQQALRFALMDTFWARATRSGSTPSSSSSRCCRSLSSNGPRAMRTAGPPATGSTTDCAARCAGWGGWGRA